MFRGVCGRGDPFNVLTSIMMPPNGRRACESPRPSKIRLIHVLGGFSTASSCPSSPVAPRNLIQALSVLRIGSIERGGQSFQFHGGGINAAGRPVEEDSFQAFDSKSGSLTDRVQFTGGNLFVQLLQTPSSLFTIHCEA